MNRADDAIFLLGEGNRLERVPLAPYDSEDLLQRLVDEHPDLLAGEQIDPADPVRWLVVAREAAIPDSDGGSDRWAIDHLLIDHRARPTFVEVKRSADPRIRREVVGQMLDYAANAQAYWPADRIREMAAGKYGSREALEEAIHQVLSSTTGEDPTDRVESFWSEVEENLRNGQVRLLFVADELPRELRRVIEFLNSQMPRVEVLGIEIRQYKGRNLQALVPRLIGQTEQARQEKKGRGPKRKMTREDFLRNCGNEAAPFFEELLDDMARNGLQVSWGETVFSARVPRSDGSLCSLFYGWPPGPEGVPGRDQSRRR